jgi:lipopolysaccharide biosynthesis protein
MAESDHAAAERITSLAFYLPQFHPIPENDLWWGAGFTEWTNVRAARPRFAGHQQPLVPGRVGYYDLRDDSVREQQEALAAEYRIDVFVYYHYWFLGHRLLEMPLERLLASADPEMKFCLCWANESWSRRWDGSDNEILIAQTYSRDDDMKHVAALLRIWDDGRYFRIDDRPVMLVYRADSHPDIRRLTEVWRAEAQRAGHMDLFLIRVESFGQHGDPRELGFDAACEFQPSAKVVDRATRLTIRRTLPERLRYGPLLPERLRTSHRRLRRPLDRFRHYDDLYEAWRLDERVVYERYPCVVPSWDNTARRRFGARIIHGSTPETYERWVHTAALRALELERHLLFVNAWNEWAESAVLEPTARWGEAYLAAHRRGVEAAESEVESSGARRTKQNPAE